MPQGVGKADTSGNRGPSGGDRLGELVTGTVEAVHAYGVFVDLGLDHIGHIDPFYIDDTDVYDIGDRVEVYLVAFHEHNGEYELRPKGKMSLSEWLRRNREGNVG